MTTWYVQAGAKGGDGSEASPFGTLAAANRAAKAGDEVVVGEGIYREQVQLKTPRVAWRSRTPGGAVIDGDWDGKSVDNLWANQVAIGGEGVQFIDFTVRSCPRALYISGDEAIVDGVRVDKTVTTGVVIGKCRGATLRRAVITRTVMAWVAARRPGGASIGMVDAVDCVVEGCSLMHGYGEALDIGRGSDRCRVSDNAIGPHAHLGVYLNRAIGCVVERNLIFQTDLAEFNVGAENWPAGIVIGDEGGDDREGMNSRHHSEANIVRFNVLVNVGSFLEVRNNEKNYNTRLDPKTEFSFNTLIAGPHTDTGFVIRPNVHDRPHGTAQVHGNVVYWPGAKAAELVQGGAGLAWSGNAWSVAPPAQAKSPTDIVGELGLTRPEAGLKTEWPAGHGHNVTVDNYRPAAGSRLIGAGPGGAVIGALGPATEEPPEEPPPPPPPLPVEPDWAGLLARVEAAQEQLAVAGMARDAAESELTALRQLLTGYQANGGS